MNFKQLLTILLTFSINVILGQVTVNVEIPFLNKKVYIYSYNSTSGTLYTGIENRFGLVVPDSKSRDLSIAITPTDFEFEEDWVAYSTGTSRHNTIGLTRRGVVDNQAKNEYDRHPDTEDTYWEKEYLVKSDVAQKIDFTIYIRVSDTAFILYQNVSLIVKNPPSPELIIEDFKYFKTHKKITPTFDKDFLMGNEWYKIKRYHFIAFDKKGRILYEQTVIGDIITPEMVNVLSDKRLNKIKLVHIKSDKFDYEDVLIYNEK
jgi:hypothetical protein